jgi:hypothetical protein
MKQKPNVRSPKGLRLIVSKTTYPTVFGGAEHDAAIRFLRKILKNRKKRVFFFEKTEFFGKITNFSKF